MSISKLLIWVKPNTIHLDCFTSLGVVATHNPIASASNYIPDWWKKLDRTFNSVEAHTKMVLKRPTMKTCAGFLELYQHGVVMPVWSDIAVAIEKEGYRYKYSLDEGEITSHDKASFGNNFKNYHHLKFISPWLFREKRGEKFLFTGCDWSLLNECPKMSVLTGVTEYTRQNGSHINTLFLIEDQPRGYLIKAGTPFVHLIPLSKKKVVPHIHVVDKVEYEKYQRDWSSYRFVGSYLRKSK